MLDRLLDKIGDRNPQLFREVKARVSWPSAIATLFVSICIQLIPIVIFRLDFNRDRHYFWQQTIGWLDNELWCLAAIGGIYLLSRDLQQELRSGTFALLNLSPIPTRNIISGKLLGVPILIYGVAALTIPIHLLAARTIGSQLLWVDAVSISLLVVLYLTAILNVVEAPLPPILISPILAASGWLFIFGYSRIAALPYFLTAISTIGCFLIISLGYLNFITSWYRDIRFIHQHQGSIFTFFISSSFLLMPIIFILVQPLAMLFLLVIFWMAISILEADLRLSPP